MSVADRDRLVFEEYADLGRHLAGVWRKERVRCLACRWGWCLFTGLARAGLSMVGISPFEVYNEAAERRVASGVRPEPCGSAGAGADPGSGAGSGSGSGSGEGDR